MTNEKKYDKLFKIASHKDCISLLTYIYYNRFQDENLALDELLQALKTENKQAKKRQNS